MAIELIIRTTPTTEQRTSAFDKDIITIGRDPTSDVRFDMAGDLNVSTRHAEIRLSGAHYEIIDQDSSNGTLVNGVRIRWPHRLRAGDTISLGRAGPELRVRVAGDEVWYPTEVTQVRPGPVQLHPELARNKTLELMVGLVESRTRSIWMAIIAGMAVLGGLSAVGWSYMRSTNAVQRELDEATITTVRTANENAVALLETYIPGSDCRGGCEGTGFIVTSDGLLVTNRHVVVQHGVQPSMIRVKLTNTRAWVTATLVSVPDDTSIDLALVQLPRTRQYPTVTGVSEQSADLPVGSAVITIGFPRGTRLRMEGTGANVLATPTVTKGSISKLLRSGIEIDAYANHGSSGSPVFDRHGHVIGVISGGRDERIIDVVPGQMITPLRALNR